MLLCFSYSVQAGSFYSGNQLKTYCNSSNYFEDGMCMGYISGVSDSFSGVFFCPPSGVTLGQMKAMVKKYMDETPAKLHESASDVVVAALKKDFSCKKKK
jgi:Rap1a immunity proteins